MRGVRRVVVRVARWRRVTGPSLPGDDDDVDHVDEDDDDGDQVERLRSYGQPAVSWRQWSCVVPFVHWCCYVPDEAV